MPIFPHYAKYLMKEYSRKYSAMKKQPLEKDTILKRVNGIQADLAEIQELGKQTLEMFSSGNGYKLAEYRLK